MNTVNKPNQGRLVVDSNTPELPFRVYSEATQGNIGFFFSAADAQRFAASGTLLEELVLADKILKAMLNAMPKAKKFALAAKLEAEGISPDGMIRAHERALAISRAGAQ